MQTKRLSRSRSGWARGMHPVVAALAVAGIVLACGGGGGFGLAANTATPASTATPAFTATPSGPTIGSTTTRSADGMTLMYVPEGEFIMGDDFSERELPAHMVYLDAYWIDQTEVTNAMYSECVLQGGCISPNDVKSLTRKEYYDQAQFTNFPVIYVSWDKAAKYCEWAGARLPTEAEWEKAARGTDGRQWPWAPSDEYRTGDSGLSVEDWEYGAGNSIRDAATSCQQANWGNCMSDTSAVATFDKGKSPYGLYDMAGNVAEWVADYYEKNYYIQSPPNNPTGPSDGNERVLRGGAFNNLEFNVRAGVRSGVVPLAADYYIGFRCAQDVK